MKEKNCTLCNGTGWVIKKKGEYEFAQKCDCQFIDIIILKSKKANIPERFWRTKIEFMGTEGIPNSQKKAIKIVKKFIGDYPAVGNTGLLLQGSTGVGKTRLLSIIANELMEKFENIDIYYIDWNDLVKEMRSGESHSTRDFFSINQLINKLISVDLLLFDELGASKVSPWVQDNIYYLFNKRYNNQKITTCATNFMDKSINNQEILEDRIGNRIRSRLYEMTKIIEIGEADFRRQHKENFK